MNVHQKKSPATYYVFLMLSGSQGDDRKCFISPAATRRILLTAFVRYYQSEMCYGLVTRIGSIYAQGVHIYIYIYGYK